MSQIRSQMKITGFKLQGVGTSLTDEQYPK
jgi:hypothetical protein